MYLARGEMYLARIEGVYFARIERVYGTSPEV
jgi:hypothetical protein